mmetsp:Transcript_9223/g.26213  ORF Transcript_9223/g.26213 Transcript_9223/m.26213 type:complete len:211 (-) Transcript_9223:1181-1813(-)
MQVVLRGALAAEGKTMGLALAASPTAAPTTLNVILTRARGNAEAHQCFRIGGVNAKRSGIEVALRGPEVDRHGEALESLASLRANHVEANDALAFALQTYHFGSALIRELTTVVPLTMRGGAEKCLPFDYVRLHVLRPKHIARRLLAQPYAAILAGREHSARHQRCSKPWAACQRGIEQPDRGHSFGCGCQVLGENLSLANSNGREFRHA